jgi:hypothetical protein
MAGELSVLENKVLCGIYEHKRMKITTRWGNIEDEIEHCFKVDDKPASYSEGPGLCVRPEAAWNSSFIQD